MPFPSALLPLLASWVQSHCQGPAPQLSSCPLLLQEASDQVTLGGASSCLPSHGHLLQDVGPEPAPAPRPRAAPVLDAEPDDTSGPAESPHLPPDPEELRPLTATAPTAEPTPACRSPGATSTGDQWAVPEEEPTPGPSGEASCLQSQPRRDAWDVLAFPPRMMAEQLTWMDLELFKKVVPQQCLGAVWSRRKEKVGGEHVAPTVQATVTQFNSVVSCVITSCLRVQTMNVQDRARRIEHWIQVAKECRHLRSFSALHAILCALRSSTLQRLQETWNSVRRKRARKFRQLCKTDSRHSKILFFHETQGRMVSLLKKPYTLQRKWKKGAVPFLGKALAELLRLHYMEDYVVGGLIQEQKEMRENHILKEIVLLQEDADVYDLEPVDSFMESFQTMERLSREESYALSCLLESGNLKDSKTVADLEPWNTVTFFLLDFS